jgi:hypothetical protein
MNVKGLSSTQDSHVLHWAFCIQESAQVKPYFTSQIESVASCPAKPWPLCQALFWVPSSDSVLWLPASLEHQRSSEWFALISGGSGIPSPLPEGQYSPGRVISHREDTPGPYWRAGFWGFSPSISSLSSHWALDWEKIWRRLRKDLEEVEKARVVGPQSFQSMRAVKDSLPSRWFPTSVVQAVGISTFSFLVYCPLCWLPLTSTLGPREQSFWTRK